MTSVVMHDWVREVRGVMHAATAVHRRRLPVGSRAPAVPNIAHMAGAMTWTDASPFHSPFIQPAPPKFEKFLHGRTGPHRSLPGAALAWLLLLN